jgi:ABC-2 type transport system permease protein
MHKIWLIIQREYLVRVRKKSFIVMTLLGPILLAGLMVVPVWLATVSDDTEVIQVLDESGLFAESFEDQGNIRFVNVRSTQEEAKEDFLRSKSSGLLYIPPLDLEGDPTGIRLFSRSNVSMRLKTTIENILRKEIEDIKFRQSGIDRDLLDRIQTRVSIGTVNLSDGDEQDSNVMVTTAVGFIGAILIYFFIFLYGVQIMRGVIEEKTSRIVEVMISSVKPFQLMMGKIIGIAAVGLTQFLLWIILTATVTAAVGARFQMDRFSDAQIEQTLEETTDVQQAKEVNSFLSALSNINVPLILGCFLFYFLGGYLLYGSLFGAVGAAVDNETDSQQFMLPITIPLVLSFVVAQTVILKNPDGPVAFWMSMVPFTSPIIMMLRIPFGVPTHEILLSMAFLVLGFMATTWIAGRIYRVGILMYGKKITYRELSKWLFYKV